MRRMIPSYRHLVLLKIITSYASVIPSFASNWPREPLLAGPAVRIRCSPANRDRGLNMLTERIVVIYSTLIIEDLQLPGYRIIPMRLQN